jgi:hypothetical protein
MDVTKFLKDAKKKGAWAEQLAAAATSSGGQGDIGNGIYIGKVVQLDFDESQSAGRPQLIWGLDILQSMSTANDEFVGETKRDYFQLDGDRSFEFLAKRMKSCDAPIDDMDDPSDLPEFFAAFLAEEPVVKFKLSMKSGSDFQNCIILKRLYDYELPEVEDDPEPVKPSVPRTPPAAPKPPVTPGKPATPPPAAKQKPAPPVAKEPEPVSDDEEATEIQVGMKVTFTHDANGEELPKPLTGLVKAFVVIDADTGEGTADIKVGLKVHKGISFEFLEAVEDANGLDA